MTQSHARSDDCLGFETRGRAEARNSGIERSGACPGSETRGRAATQGIAGVDDRLGSETRGRVVTQSSLGAGESCHCLRSVTSSRVATHCLDVGESGRCLEFVTRGKAEI